MKTYTIRSWGKDKTGLVLHTVEVDGVVVQSDLGFSEAVVFAESQAEDGDIIQEAYRSEPPYHQRVFDSKNTQTSSGKLGKVSKII